MNDYEYEMYDTPTKPNLYSNKFTLYFSNEFLEATFFNFSMKQSHANWIRVLIITHVVPLLIQSIDSVLTFTISLDMASRLECIFLRFFQLFSLLITILNFINWCLLHFKKRENKNFFKFYQIFCYFAYLVILNAFISFVASYSDENGVTFPNSYKHFLMMLLKLVYLFFIDNQFIKIFPLNLLSLGIEIVYEFTITKDGTLGLRYNSYTYFNIGAKVVSCIIVTLFAYYEERLSRQLFYYKYKVLKTNLLMTNLLNQMQNGVVIFKKKKSEDQGKIKYINNFASHFEQFNKNFKLEGSFVDDLEKEDSNFPSARRKKHPFNLEFNQLNGTTEGNLCEMNYSGKNNGPGAFHTNNFTEKDADHEDSNKTYGLDKDFSEYQLFNIFEKIQEFNPELSENIVKLFKLKNLKVILTELESCEYITYFKNFKYIGLVHLTRNRLYFQTSTTGEEFYLNLYLKIYEINNKVSYEIILNDVTRTKTLEENKIKAKTMMLAKISHEFKNPLIVINETIDQVISERNGSYLDRKKLKFIKNLSNYMILLVKYFEFMSSLENKLKLDINPEVYNIHKELEYLSEIAVSLMQKSNILNQVSFKLTIDPNVPKLILIDKMRLEQILINLISNSIKFTNFGSIELKVDFISDRLKRIRSNDSISSEEREQIQHCYPTTRTSEKIFVMTPKEDKNEGETLNQNTPNFKKRNQFNSDDFDLDYENFDTGDRSKNQKPIPPSVLVESLNQACQLAKHSPEQTDNDVQYIRFSVIDSGKGINKEDEKNLFKTIMKESSVRNILGSGYGLNIVNEICMLLKSKINYERNHPNGSIFFFDIPYSQSKVISSLSEINNSDVSEDSSVREDELQDIEKIQKSLQNAADKLGNNHRFSNPERRNNEDQGICTEEDIKGEIELRKCSIEDENKIATRTDMNFFKLLTKEEFTNLFSMRAEKKYRSLTTKDKSTRPPEKTRKKTDTSLVKKRDINNFSNIVDNNICFSFLEMSSGGFLIKLKTQTLLFGNGEKKRKKINILLTDDEEIIRRSIIRLLTTFFKNKKKDYELFIMEAYDGIETILAIYLAQKQNIRIDFIISDETMNFMNGSYSTHIIQKLASLSIIHDTPVYMNTAYGNGIDQSKFSSSVKKIFSKPIDIKAITEIMSNIEN